MTAKHYYFAGGGTGGHIYPAIAIAEELQQQQPDCKITFFCSERNIDRQILSSSGFDFIQLGAVGFSVRPDKLIKFYRALQKSIGIVKKELAESENPVVISCGGFASAPVVLAAHKLNNPIYMLNVDIVPGKANRFLARFAEKIFVQFDNTAKGFGCDSKKVITTGCPLRSSFKNPDRTKVFSEFELDKDKKVLLITGASSGAANINNALGCLVDKLAAFAEQWQVVHLAGRDHIEVMKEFYSNAKMSFTVLDYYDNMADMLAAADLLIGRAGAVSIAEYAAIGVPAVCMPYPYHKNKHQQLNATKLVEAGCAVIVEDFCDSSSNAEALWPVLEDLMKDENKRLTMRQSAKEIAGTDAAKVIVSILTQVKAWSASDTKENRAGSVSDR